MSKNKNDKNIISDFEKLAGHIGLTAMSVAALAGLVEMHESRLPKLVNPMQPAYAVATDHAGQGEPIMHETSMRREKDEIKHMTVSYGVTMRSHPVTGKA
jgi:hypothetical protein